MHSSLRLQVPAFINFTLQCVLEVTLWQSQQNCILFKKQRLYSEVRQNGQPPQESTSHWEPLSRCLTLCCNFKHAFDDDDNGFQTFMAAGQWGERKVWEASELLAPTTTHLLSSAVRSRPPAERATTGTERVRYFPAIDRVSDSVRRTKRQKVMREHSQLSLNSMLAGSVSSALSAEMSWDLRGWNQSVRGEDGRVRKSTKTNAGGNCVWPAVLLLSSDHGLDHSSLHLQLSWALKNSFDQT